jgi:hypothetical protein
MGFEKSVFINCPFDSEYLPLLHSILFTTIYLGLKPRIALESLDAGESRLEKILRLIRESRYSIHDISRLRSTEAGEFARLNMPFELGIDYGSRKFGGGRLRAKRALVLETHQHRYQAALSDLAGADIESHDNDPYKVIHIVRAWLKNVCHMRAPGPTQIEGAFTDFQADATDELTGQGFSAHDIDNLPIPEWIEHMEAWVSRQCSLVASH